MCFRWGELPLVREVAAGGCAGAMQYADSRHYADGAAQSAAAGRRLRRCAGRLQLNLDFILYSFSRLSLVCVTDYYYQTVLIIQSYIQYIPY